MAEEKGGGGSAWGGIGWFFLILGALFVMWVFSGGYERASKDDKFIQPNDGIQIGETYDKPVTIFDTTF